MHTVDLTSIYKNVQAEESIEQESSEGYYAEGYIIDNGVYLDIMGMEYPSRSVAPIMNLWSMNIAKRIFVLQLRMLKLLPKLPFRPIKTVDELLALYNETSLKAVSPYIWKDELLPPVAREMKPLMTIFLLEIGIGLKRF